MKKIKLLIAVLALLLAACSSENGTVSPEPAELFSNIQQTVSIPEMVDVAEAFLEDELGITADQYESAVYYLVEEGLAPDEIVIVKAKDEDTAGQILEKLENRLAYKEESAQLYLTEFMPVIQNGVIRQDGLTVSLIVSEQVEQIEEVYRQYK